MAALRALRKQPNHLLLLVYFTRSTAGNGSGRRLALEDVDGKEADGEAERPWPRGGGGAGSGPAQARSAQMEAEGVKTWRCGW